jgi:hypothetical protein
MKKILTEAVVVEAKKGIKLELLLKEAMANPLFNNSRKFQNELEIELLNEVSGTFGRSPTGGSISVRGGGSGMYGVATKPLGRLAQALKDAKMDGFESLNEISQSIEKVMAAVDPVVDFLESKDESIKAQANILLAKVFVYIKGLTDVVISANKQLRQMLPVSFNPEKARAAMVAATRKAREAEIEADERETKGKEGLGARIIKGIKRIFGSKDEGSLNEGLMSNLLNPGHGELDKFTSKVDAFIDSSIESCNELIEESNTLLEEDFYRLPQAGERTRLLLELVGLLKKYKCDLENIPWQLRQRMG